MSNPPVGPRVPIIGLKKPEVVCHYTAAQCVVTCDCGSPTPIVIPGLDRAGLCVACKSKYVIARLDFTNAQGQVSMNIQVGKWLGPMAASFDLDLPDVQLS